MLLAVVPIRDSILACLAREPVGPWTRKELLECVGRSIAATDRVLYELVEEGLIRGGLVAGAGNEKGYELIRG